MVRCIYPGCDGESPDSARECILCNRDIGYPNVRAADFPHEISELLARAGEQRRDAVKRGCIDILDKFEDMCSNAAVVISRPISEVKDLIENDNKLYHNYYHARRQGVRVPEDNEWDQKRERVDTTVFTGYHEEIVFGALTITGKGVVGYGGGCMILKESTISHRTTFFEENTFTFVQKHDLRILDDVPSGFRSNWSNRGALAVAKLGRLISPTTQVSEFASILSDSGTRTSDFIEAHIYGAIHAGSIKKLLLPVNLKRMDKVLMKSITTKCRDRGIELETY